MCKRGERGAPGAPGAPGAVCKRGEHGPSSALARHDEGTTGGGAALAALAALTHGAPYRADLSTSYHSITLYTQKKANPGILVC